MSLKEIIAKRAAREIQDGSIINLGIGIPTLIPKYLDAAKTVIVHSENGIIGMGPACPRGSEDRNLIDAGGRYVTVNSGASFCDSVLSFSLIRGGRLDLAFLGALEVSKTGDLANWIIPGKYSPGIGGGMEVAQKARRLIVTITHTDRKGRPKILNNCTLPLTARKCVSTIITELGVFDILETGLHLREISKETDIDHIIRNTEADIILPEGELLVF
jgi:3-oxoacid CoA-transferase B subunit